MLEVDADRTRRVYGNLTGAPERCGCNICKNFIVARDRAYPSDLRQLLDQLGIDYRREAELSHTHRTAPGHHQYAGAFHFVGAIEDGGESASLQDNGLYIMELVSVNADFDIGFSTRITNAACEFSGQRLVQIDFAVDAPWLLPLDEPS
jgi:hypothetical protein